MPKDNIIISNSIREQQLQPHLQNKFANNSANSIIEQNTTIIAQYEAGENINYGDLVYLDFSQKLYKASNTTQEADFISISSGLIGSIIKVSKLININITLPYNNGAIILLGASGGYTDTTPDTTYIFQKIGIYNNNILHCKIENSYIIE